METTEEASLKRVFGLPTSSFTALVIFLALASTQLWAKLPDFLAFSSGLFSGGDVSCSMTALSYAELGSRFPFSGGVASFVHRAFRTEWLSVIVGWLMFCTCIVSMATLSKAFAGYLTTFTPSFQPGQLSWRYSAVLPSSFSRNAGIFKPEYFLYVA
jgi:amino acid transporter